MSEIGTRLHELAEELALSKDSPMGYQEVANRLRELINAGTYQPDDVLPRQDDIAAEHGVNIHTVRKAVDLLASEGYLEPIRRRGTVVRDPSAVRIEAIVDLLWHAKTIEGEWGRKSEAFDDARAALRALGVTDAEIEAATRKVEGR